MSKTILSKEDILTERKMSIDVENIVEKNLIIFNELTSGFNWPFSDQLLSTMYG